MRPGLGCSAFARHYLRNHCCFLFLRVLRCFSSPGCSPCGFPVFNREGFPIRTPADQWSFAPPRSFSQLTTSFVISGSQGIPHAPLIRFLLFGAPRNGHSLALAHHCPPPLRGHPFLLSFPSRLVNELFPGIFPFRSGHVHVELTVLLWPAAFRSGTVDNAGVEPVPRRLPTLGPALSFLSKPAAAASGARLVSWRIRDSNP